MELRDAYISVREALYHAGWDFHRSIAIDWIDSQTLEEEDPERILEGLDGIVVPGGFGHRGIEGMVLAARYARENEVPYLGLCLGLQVMVVEFARHLFDSDEANSTEFYPESPYPVISLLSEQKGVAEKGGTMRLGNYPCRLVAGTKAHSAYGRDEVVERHRHRYEFNNEFRQQLEEAGLMASGTSPDGSLVEICELRGHPWMVGSQFHPELRSRPNRPHPLFDGFLAAAAEHSRAGKGAAGVAGRPRASRPVGTGTGGRAPRPR